MTRTSRASPEFWRSDAEMGDHPASREPHPGQNGRRSGNRRAMEAAHSARPGMSMLPIRAMQSLNGVIIPRGRPSDLAHTRQIAQRAFGHERQALYDERRQVVLKYYILKVAVKLRNGLLRAANRG